MSKTTATQAPPASKAPAANDGWGKFFGGLLFGAAMTWFSLKTGRKPPTILELPQKIAALPHQLVASTVLDDADSTIEQRQRAIATLLKHDDDLFARIDNVLDHQFSDAIMDEKIHRRLIRAKLYRSSFDKVLEDDKYQALRQGLERKYGTTDTDLLRQRMLAERLEDDSLLLKSLKDQFPDDSTEQLAARILNPAGPPIRR